MGVEWVDTRAITRHVRLQGAMKAVISTEDMDKKSLVKKAKSSPGLIGRDLVKDVTSSEIYNWKKKKKYKNVRNAGREAMQYGTVWVIDKNEERYRL